MKSCLALILFVVACVSSSSALRCFGCKFPEEPSCENLSGSESLFIMECPALTVSEKAGSIQEVCMKNVIRVNNQDHITRECAKQVEEFNSCSILKDLSNHCSVCKSDLCNGSEALVVNKRSVLLAIVVASLMKFL